MIEMDDLWVGDQLRVRSSGRIGSFQGLAKDGRVRIRSNNKTYLVHAGQLEKVEDIERHLKLAELQEDSLPNKRTFTRVENQIDLHIEKLNPNLLNALPERIVDYQIKEFEKYLTLAIAQNLKFLSIIHGRGTGVLRSHIHQYLKTTKAVKHFHLTNNDGATEVTLK